MILPKRRLTMCPKILRPKRRWGLAHAGLGHVIACMLMTGCASAPEFLQPVSSLFWNTVNKSRSPGPSLIDNPQKVATDFDCANRPQPWVLLETQQLQPGRLYANDELNERFVYVLCPAQGHGGLRGTLTRRVLSRGKAIWSDVARDYELQPGRWSVDLFLTIPVKAEAGPYEFEVAFETNKVIFRDSKNFTVVRR